MNAGMTPKKPGPVWTSMAVRTGCVTLPAENALSAASMVSISSGVEISSRTSDSRSNKGMAVLFAKEISQHEQHVRGPLGEAPHEPGNPCRSVSDENFATIALARQTLLLSSADPVAHLKLLASLC